MYKFFLKRVLDFVLSLFAMFILSPLFLVFLVLVKTKLCSLIIFKQIRPGKNGKLFVLYKFRTMTNEMDSNGILLPDEKRLTKFGKWLRDSSMDELPEIFNILKGDMALIGPRPQLVKDYVFFDENSIHRQDVRPGLTGLAQVNGRNNITWEDKFKYDLEYVHKKHIFMFDVSIFFKTIKKAIFSHDDINTNGMATSIDYGDYLLQNNFIDEEEYKIKVAKANEMIGNYVKHKN